MLTRSLSCMQALRLCTEVLSRQYTHAQSKHEAVLEGLTSPDLVAEQYDEIDELDVVIKFNKVDEVNEFDGI